LESLQSGVYYNPHADSRTRTHMNVNSAMLGIKPIPKHLLCNCCGGTFYMPTNSVSALKDGSVSDWNSTEHAPVILPWRESEY